MRRRLIIAIAAVAAITVVALAVSRATSGGGDDATPAAFSEETRTAGPIDIALQPDHVDATGAEIKVTLDTHSVELDMDLVAGVTLEVGGVLWPAVAWEGDGPSGHHREGRLRFDPAGPAGGLIELRLAGFDEPVTATWEARR